MTGTELGQLMRTQADELDPAALEGLVRRAVTAGGRRRRRRSLAAGASAAGVVAVVAALAVGTAVLTGGPPTDRADEPVAAPTSSAVPSVPPTAAPTYAAGSATDVPGGPVIATDREPADDAALLEVTRALLPPDAVAEGLTVRRTTTSDPSHEADRTRDGRLVSLSLDGALTTVTLQRWDGYAAVGIALRDGEDLTSALEDPAQEAATTAREACAGSYRSFPPLACTPTDGGWYEVARPSQGGAAPAADRELLVQLYTDDGWVVRVDSYNTPGEKSGTALAEQPVLTAEESLAVAGSPRWFVPSPG